MNEETEGRTFGCTVRMLEEFAETRVGKGKTFETLQDAATSILSDAQEELGMGRSEQARQAINRAKWLIEASKR